MRGKYLSLVLLSLIGAAVVHAMRLPQGTTGSIDGFVRDEKGAPIAGVSVQAFNIMHGETGKAVAQPSGFFRIAQLAGGKYSLWIQASGYSSQQIPLVVVENGKATRKNIQLTREVQAYLPMGSHAD